MPIQNNPPAENVSLDWIANNSIAVFTILDVKDETMDKWLNVTKELYMSWDADKPLLVVQDFSQIKVYKITKKARQNAKELSRVRDDIYVKSAVIMPEKVSFRAHVLQLVLRTLYNPRNVQRQRQIFFTRDEALTWLQDGSNGA